MAKAKARDRESPKTGATKIQAEQRRRYAMERRIAGASYQDIADEFGVSYQRANKIVNQALDNLKTDVKETAETLRAQEIARLDKMLSSLWTKVEKGDDKAINAALRIEERRCKLLGIDAPEKLDHSSSDGSMSPPNRVEIVPGGQGDDSSD